jgi:hypothetical protein
MTFDLTCHQGDSGGPLYAKLSDGRVYLLGVSSNVRFLTANSTGVDCLSAFFAQFTSVTHHVDWINETIWRVSGLRWGPNGTVIWPENGGRGLSPCDSLLFILVAIVLVLFASEPRPLSRD